MPSPLLTDYLPQSIHELMAIISLKSIDLLIKNYGGTRVQIPKKAHALHELAELIGMEDFNALCARYGSTALDLPRCVKALAAVRNSQILKDKREGLSLAQVARKYHMTERGVSMALRRIEKQEYQPWVRRIHAGQVDLFDATGENDGTA